MEPCAYRKNSTTSRKLRKYRGKGGVGGFPPYFLECFDIFSHKTRFSPPKNSKFTSKIQKIQENSGNIGEKKFKQSVWVILIACLTFSEFSWILGIFSQTHGFKSNILVKMGPMGQTIPGIGSFERKKVIMY